MGYSEAQRALAIGIVQQNNGRLDAATLAAVRAALNAPTLSQQLIRYWISVESKAAKKPKRVKSVALIEAPGTPPVTIEPTDLTGKQRAFAEAYVDNGFNGTKAARTAQYSGDDNALAVVASQNLRKPQIRAYIERLLAERVMGRNEVLARIADQATASLGDFFGPNDLPESMRQSDKLHLLKKIKVTNKEYMGIKTQFIELELHDPQAALVQLGRHYKLFTDKTEVNLPDDLMRMLPQLIDVFGGSSETVEIIRELMQRKQAALAMAEGDGHV